MSTSLCQSLQLLPLIHSLMNYRIGRANSPKLSLSKIRDH
ncbi:hypothetical protein amyaer_2845 [Microcystis aeruginosa NIES-2481]|uniref:Uncharacterized protein n=1 Tax=Microcystis aeruginosa PCC 9701 TaxID=721123 RepID=I4IP21_MICAE|nr:hypothetical protein amyaer_2845 [Microcystis aeruginosa NIES-2481]CCI36045.1 hypothetical protein MICAK_220015 [Microcystis aeruginosa PCC 9701]